MRALSLNVCLLLLCVSSFAQQYSFVHYTPKDGLINSRVRNAYQDSKGRIYFTTYGGLSVFDGARFINYTTQHGLMADLVNDVLEVGEDSLLVATNNCGLNVLVQGQIKPLNIAANLCVVFNKLLKSDDGNVYAITDQGLYKISKKGIEELPLNIPGRTGDLILVGALEEYKDFLIFSTYDVKTNELFLYNKKTRTLTDLIKNKAVGIYSIVKDRTGLPWLGTSEATFQLDTIALVKGKLEMIHQRPTTLPGGIIHFNSQNELLISGTKSEIIHYRLDGSVKNIALPENYTRIQNFFIDREDVIWVCHDGNGIFKLPGIKFQSDFFSYKNNTSGIRTTTGIINDTRWIMMNNDELLKLDATGTKAFTISPSFSPIALIPGKKYFFAPEPHALYLTILPGSKERILRFKKIITLPDTAAFGGVFVTDKNENTILFESRKICVLDGEKLLFTYPLLTVDLVQGMHLDKNNRLWVINRYNGLMIFSLHPESPGNYLKKELHFTAEFKDNSPRSMVVDGNNIIWIGNRYNGLMGFRMENDQLKKVWHFQTQDGLTDNFVTSLACDKHDNIIIGTQTGLDRLIKKNEGYQLENITKPNNIFSYINAVWTDSSNTAFAWTKTGEIMRIEPPSSEKLLFDPQILIEEIKINGKSLGSRPVSLRLDHKQRNISFSVAAPSFIDEKQIKFSYLLSGGSNTEWSDTSSLADISFLDLSPGHYTLHVKAFFPSTSYTTKETQFSFFIKPPWWQTWWFRTAIGLLGVGILVIIIRFYYRRKLEKQRVVLEKQQAIEKERTRIASDMHDDLGAGLSTIRFLSEKVKRNSFSDITKDDSEKIVTNSNELMQKMNEIIWAMNEKNDTLEDLIFYTRSYAMEYCSENHLACETNLPKTIPSLFVSGEIRRNVFLTVKESLHNIIKHADAKKVTLDFTVDDALAVTIRDDGKGFTGEKNNGNGLRNMKKRIESVKGDFEMTNAGGVTIKMKIPLPL